MDALAIGCVALMVSAITDLRRFRTMDPMDKVRNIGALGVGAMVVTIQLIEHFRPR